MEGHHKSHPLLTKAEFQQQLAGLGYEPFQASMLFNAIIRTFYPRFSRYFNRSAEDVVYIEDLRDSGREEAVISIPNFARAMQNRPLEEERTIGPYRNNAARSLITAVLGEHSAEQQGIDKAM